MEPAPLYAFGPFRLSPAGRRLWRDGCPVELTPKAIDTLLVLVEHRGEVVPKEVLLQAVWPDTVVEENYLAVNVAKLRAALGETPRDWRYIETVARRGYRFTSQVEVLDALEPRAPREPGAPPETKRAALPLSAPRRPRGPALALSGLGAGAFLLILGAANLWRTPSPPPPPTAAVVEEAPPLPLPDQAAPSRRQAAEAAAARGEFLFTTRRHWDDALHAFRQAATLDSTYAPAYIGMANVYALGQGATLEAEAALERALALDPTLGEAYATLGFVRAFQRWDWAGAEGAFRQALALAPGHVRTHQWHAVFLLLQRRLPEAEAAVHRALALDPASPNLHSDLCEIRLARRDFAGARAACERALGLDPDFLFARQHVFWLNLVERSPEAALRWSVLTRVYQRPRVPATSDPDAFLAGLAADLALTAPMVAFDAYLLARVEAVRGNADGALDALALAVRQRAFHVPFANADPVFDGVRADRRFRALMNEVGLNP